MDPRAKVSKVFKRFTNKAKKGLRPTLYFHQSIALIINLLAVITSNPFNLMPKESYWIFITLSVIATYTFFYNYKSYDIYDFESLYVHLK